MANKKKALSFAEIQKADDRKLEKIEITEWGGVVYIRPLSAAELLEHEKTAAGDDVEPADVSFSLLGQSLVDEEGNRIFSDDKLDVLREKNPRVITRLVKEIERVNGVSGDETEKKTTSDPADDSPSSSRPS